MKKAILLLMFAVLVGCTSQPQQQPIQKKLVVTVVDYSKSYRSLITLDSLSVQSLFLCVAGTGGTIAHIGIQENSHLPVYLTRVEKLDTTGPAKNIYKDARAKQHNKNVLSTYEVKLQDQVSRFMQETRKYHVSSFTDLHALELVHSTVCESLYANGTYKRFILVLSDLLHDVPRGGTKFQAVDVCDATVVIVRPAACLTQDSLQAMFNGADVHVFSNLTDATSFINEY